MSTPEGVLSLKRNTTVFSVEAKPEVRGQKHEGRVALGD